MAPVQELGRNLIVVGGILILAGLICFLAGRFPGIGRLPGDILIQKKNFTFYFPLATSIIVSVILSLFFWFWSKR